VVQLLTLDVGAFSAFFCRTAGFDYYDSMMAMTGIAFGLLLCTAAAAYVLERKTELVASELVEKRAKFEKKSRRTKRAMFCKSLVMSSMLPTQVDLCCSDADVGVFLYPILNLKVFQMFVCQVVSEKSYLRCDYSVECLTGKWWGYVSYGILWVLGYTVGFPAWLWIFLHRNHEEIETHYQDLLSPFYKQFGFIWNDYRQVMCIAAVHCKTPH
jgi:hypothetical protein